MRLAQVKDGDFSHLVEPMTATDGSPNERCD